MKTLEHLRPDMTANITVLTARREGLVIPASTVARDGEDRFVWIDRDGVLVKQRVTLGSREDGFVEVTSGLAPAARVALSPPSGSRD
jgi:multidrug efflux pump subunit AcrA (membrane-fusion protein)